MNSWEKNSKRISQVLSHLTGVAASAADDVSDAVQLAGQAVGDRYSAIKLTFELARLQDEQSSLFAGAGRTMYLIQSSEGLTGEKIRQGELDDAHKTIDRLLLLADQKQQEIDFATERLTRLNGAKVCYVCGHVCDAQDEFCKACGGKLPIEK